MSEQGETLAPRQQTLDQQRASHAWQSIAKAQELSDSAASDCAGHAKKLPMRIRTAGLGQSLLFVSAKAKPKDSNANKGLILLLECLNDWMLVERNLAGEVSRDASDPLALVLAINSQDASFLRRATVETMAWLLWFNRFAEAEGLRSNTDEDE